ncbi:hypothetical protein BDN72DRAFT_900290 [Pluteus cervinus]|uniref:Uncharacterized protein n=1 Tax=Pluteus cervinus TaxID=181527 RepID=A0ACD3AJK3_9AGAR|nr:hypothetical protein BDN72DRAFT_900290 [Pluteus cervinus]
MGSCEAGAALFAEPIASSFAGGLAAVPDASTARTGTGSVQPWFTIQDIVYKGGIPDSGVTGAPAPSSAPSNNLPSWGAKNGSIEKACGSTVFLLVGSAVVMYLLELFDNRSRPPIVILLCIHVRVHVNRVSWTTTENDRHGWAHACLDSDMSELNWVEPLD